MIIKPSFNRFHIRKKFKYSNLSKCFQRPDKKLEILGQLHVTKTF